MWRYQQRNATEIFRRIEQSNSLMRTSPLEQTTSVSVVKRILVIKCNTSVPVCAYLKQDLGSSLHHPRFRRGQRCFQWVCVKSSRCQHFCSCSGDNYNNFVLWYRISLRAKPPNEKELKHCLFSFSNSGVVHDSEGTSTLKRASCGGARLVSKFRGEVTMTRHYDRAQILPQLILLSLQCLWAH